MFQKKLEMLPRVWEKVPAWVWPAVAFLVFAANVVYSGLLFKGVANDMDARYFYTAAQMWGSGRSPYDVADFFQTFQQIFGTQPLTGYAYLPTSLIFVLPLAPFDWHGAALVFRLVNTLAGVLLFWAVSDYIRQEKGQDLGPREWLWTALGTSLGMVAANISTGQTALMIAGSLALFLTGLRRSNPYLVVLGLVVATAKPTLTALLLLFALVFEPKQRWTILLGGLFAAAAAAWAWLLDANLVGHILASWSSYESSGTNQAEGTVGLASLAVSWGASPAAAWVVGVSALAAAALVCGWELVRTRRRLSQSPHTVGAVLLATALGFPIHNYDMAVFALPIAFTALDWKARKWWLLVPALLVWRPMLWASLLRIPDANGKILMLGWGLLLAALATEVVGKGLQGQKKS